MSIYDEDPVTRARVVRERLARLRAHETETRTRLHAAALKDLLEAGYTTSQAGKILGLHRSFVHRIANQPPIASGGCPEFDAIDAAVEKFVLG